MSDWPEALPGETPAEYRSRLTGDRIRVIQAAARTAQKVTTTEDELQSSIVEALAYVGVARAALILHIPNQGKRSPAYGARLKAMGLLPGAADICIVARGGKAHFLEVKTEAGTLSRAQKDFRGSCVALGIPWAIVRSPEEALETVKGWGLVPSPSDRSEKE